MTQPTALFLADILEDAGRPADIAEKAAVELRRLHAQQGSEGERMTTLREAATQALGALEGGADSWQLVGPAIDALKAALAEPVLQTCNCRWDGEMQMQQCTLHEAHVDAIKEWAQRAKFAEKKLAALAGPPVSDPHRDHWVAIAEAAQKIAASTECGLMEAKALCAALDRLTDAALAEPVLNPAPGYCKHCKQYTIEEPLPAEPVQEQPVCDECGKSKHDGWALYCVKCVEPMFGLQRPAEPVQEPFGYLWPTGRHPEFRFTQQKRDGVDGMPLYAAPPQRKPLSEDEKRALADKFLSCQPESYEVRGVFDLISAVERAHGIGGEE